MLGASVVEDAAAPTLRFELEVERGLGPRGVHDRAHARRSTSTRPGAPTTPDTRERLVELFGEPERWARDDPQLPLGPRDALVPELPRHDDGSRCRSRAPTTSSSRRRSTSTASPAASSRSASTSTARSSTAATTARSRCTPSRGRAPRAGGCRSRPGAQMIERHYPNSAGSGSTPTRPSCCTATRRARGLLSIDAAVSRSCSTPAEMRPRSAGVDAHDRRPRGAARRRCSTRATRSTLHAGRGEERDARRRSGSSTRPPTPRETRCDLRPAAAGGQSSRGDAETRIAAEVRFLQAAPAAAATAPSSGGSSSAGRPRSPSSPRRRAAETSPSTGLGPRCASPRRAGSGPALAARALRPQHDARSRAGARPRRGAAQQPALDPSARARLRAARSPRRSSATARPAGRSPAARASTPTRCSRRPATTCCSAPRSCCPTIPSSRPRAGGDLFDGTEIEEALLLHVLALSDDERAQIADADPAVREMVARAAEATPAELHAPSRPHRLPTQVERR